MIEARLGERADATALNASVETKQKRYTCVVWSRRALTAADAERVSAIRELTLRQRTPIRATRSVSSRATSMTHLGYAECEPRGAPSRR